MGVQQKPHLLLVDDDPRVLDFYCGALHLPQSVESQEADQEMEEMFSILEGNQPFEEPVTSLCRAVTATQGLDAIKLFSEVEASGDPFDLVLLDMRMPPGIDGLETAKRLRAIRPDLPVIFFTAYSDYRDEELKEKVGGHYCLLRKPIEEELLRAEIGKMLPDDCHFVDWPYSTITDTP